MTEPERDDGEVPSSRVLRWLPVAIVVAVALLAPFVTLWFFRGGLGGGTGPLSGPLGGKFVVSIGLMVLMPIVMMGAVLGGAAWRRRRLLARAQRHDGLLCPVCARPVVLEGSGPACCGRAPTDWGPEQYREYWALLRRDPDKAARDLAATVGPPTPNALGGLSGFAIPVVLMSVLPGILGSPTWLAEALIGIALMGVAFGVAAWLYRGAFDRTESGPDAKAPRCAKCGYQRIVESPRCPECGHRWNNRFGGVVRGPTMVRPARAVLAFVLVLAAFFATMANRFWLPRLLLGQTSTTSLIHRVTAGEAPNEREVWGELGARTLTPAEQALLVDRLVATLDDARFCGLNAKRTLVTAFGLGQLSATQLAIIREKSFRPAIVAPSRTRVGATVAFEIRGTAFDDFLPTGEYTFIAAYEAWFADEPERRFVAPTRRIEMAISLDHRFGKAEPLRIEVPTDRSASAATPLGERELVVRVWLLAGPPTISLRTTWAEDGSPILPPGGRWGEAREVRHRITIEP